MTPEEKKEENQKIVSDILYKFFKDALDKQDEKLWMEGFFIDSPMAKYPTPNWN